MVNSKIIDNPLLREILFSYLNLQTAFRCELAESHPVSNGIMFLIENEDFTRTTNTESKLCAREKHCVIQCDHCLAISLGKQGFTTLAGVRWVIQLHRYGRFISVAKKAG